MRMHAMLRRISAIGLLLVLSVGMTRANAADAVDAALFLDFNDQAWNTACNAASQCANSGSAGAPFMIPAIKNVPNAAPEAYVGASFSYNLTGGTALRFSEAAHADICLIGSTVTWGPRFLMEARVRRTTGTFSGLTLVRDNPSGTKINWYVNSSQKLVLELNKGATAGQIVATSNDAVFPDAQWVSLQVAVDLTKKTLAEAVRFSRNGTPLPLAASNTYTGTMAAGTGTIAVSALELLDRMSAFDLMCDAVRVVPNASPELCAAPEWYAGEVYSEIGAGASVAILIHPGVVLRKLANRPVDFVDGKPRSGVVLDYINDGDLKPFMGMYEINVALDSQEFHGDVTVDIGIKRPIDAAYKKIGEVRFAAGEAPAGGGIWAARHYWNCRAIGYEWTAADAVPYTADAPVKVRFTAR